MITITQLDASASSIDKNISSIRQLASDYAKRCLTLKQQRNNHDHEIQQLRQVLSLMSSAEREVFATTTTTTSTTSPPNNEKRTNKDVVQELQQTFEVWCQRSAKRRVHHTNIIRSSYKRVQNSVHTVLNGNEKERRQDTEDNEATNGSNTNMNITTTRHQHIGHSENQSRLVNTASSHSTANNLLGPQTKRTFQCFYHTHTHTHTRNKKERVSVSYTTMSILQLHILYLFSSSLTLSVFSFFLSLPIDLSIMSLSHLSLSLSLSFSSHTASRR
jgi:hypothetical protein